MWTIDSLKIHSFLKLNCKITDFNISMLAGDASNRKYFRIIDLSRRKSFVLMAWEPFQASNFPFFSVLNHFKKHKVTVPELIHYDENAGLVLLEDLGDVPLEQVFLSGSTIGTQNSPKPTYLKFYDQAIQELFKIHFHTSGDRSTCVAFDLHFDIEKLSWELNFAKIHLFEKMLGYQFSDLELKIFNETVFGIAEHLHQQPKYIQHRDYHSRNLMLKDNQIRVIDFQDARLGAIQYDLVSLLKDSYVDFPAQFEATYLEFYFKEAQNFGFPINSYEQFLKTYQIQAIQRCLKACGSFASFKVLKNDDRYLKYLRPTLKRVELLLKPFPEYKYFVDLISQTGAFQ
jgi:aminoglycoside/choline kinase family phosphotransferase